MFVSKFAPRLGVLRKATCAIQAHGEPFVSRLLPVIPAHCPTLQPKLRNYSTAADNTPPPRWIQLEPELDEALVPRKLSVSPLESWLSLRYSLPNMLEVPQPCEDLEVLEEKILPTVAVPLLEDEDGSATPLQCKNVLQIRRRMINRHKYRKLQKVKKFLKRKVLGSRGKKKQKVFEEDLRRIWKRAGLKRAPDGWNVPKLFVKHGRSRN